ncbi:MAG: OmpH family outer membrane protein [Phycisphaerae bacterium]|nr:OmpH family outer membrane protein [Phycisphaerae bacterium]
MKMSRPFGAILLLLAAVGTLTLTWKAGARFDPKPSPPNGMAVIDLTRAFEGLDEKNAKESELREYKLKLETEMKKMKETYDGEKSKFDALPDGQEKKDSFERARKLAIQLELENRFSTQKLDEATADTFRSLYAKIADASARLAKQAGYTMVVSTDEKVVIPQTGTDDVKRTISLKRFVFVDPVHDVTDDLVRMLNVEYKSAGGTVPASAKADEKAKPAAKPAGAPKKN